MSIFKRALNYVTDNTELKEKLNTLDQKLEDLTSNRKEDVITQVRECKENEIIYNVANKSVTVVDCNGDMFGGEVEKDVVELLKTADTKEIIKLLTPEKVESKGSDFDVEKEEKEIVKPFLGIFEGVDDFEVVGDKLFFKNIRSVEIPSLIAAAFVKLIEKHRDYVDEQIQTGYLVEDEEYQSLKSFTLKLLTSARKESIQQVLQFCRHNDLRISKRGNIIGYRRVEEYNEVNMSENLELLSFIKIQAEKLKKWKKGLKNYEIFKDENGSYIYHNRNADDVDYDIHIGNLYELYNNQNVLLPNTTKLYTSKHNYGKYVFSIGDIYKAEEGDINTDAGQCAAGGLHFASVNYNYSGFGQVPVVVLINPAKTITIPINEMEKGRTTEMKIACINPNEHGVHIQEELIEKADEEYEEYTTEELLEAVANKTVVNLSVKEEVTQLSIPEIKNIAELLKNRVITI